MSKIICLGPTPTVQRTMEFAKLTLDAVNRAVEVMDSASGKPLNVALTLRTLGEQSVATGFVGGDSGQFICHELDREGVRHDFVRVKPRTRTCTTVIDRAGGTCTELVEESSPVGAEDYESLTKKLGELLAGARGLVLSGSLTPGAPQTFYADCVRQAHGAGVPVIADIRGVPLHHCLGLGLLVVKPNRQELGETVGFAIDSDDRMREAIKRLTAQGPQWVIVTQGKEGAIASDGESFWRIPALKVKARNPIGAGDSFAAGLMAGVTRGQSIPQACELACACAAANTMNTPPGHARLADINDLLPQVRVEKM